VQPYYEKIFDAITSVVHEPKNASIIREFVNREGLAEERIEFAHAVKASGNIEDWLSVLLYEMRLSMKQLCEECAYDVPVS
jgi:hypothetical protein